ncbi:hypothetical protein ACVXG9_15870 [Escherichia coli]
MNIPQLTALCLRYQGVLLDASEEVVHVAVVDAPHMSCWTHCISLPPNVLRSPAGRANKWKVTPVAHNRHCP